MPYSIVQTTGWNASVVGGTGTTPAFPGNTTTGNTLLVIGIIDRYDGSPTVDAAPTVSRSGGETFTRLGFSVPTASGGTSKQIHIFAAECTTAATTAISMSDTVGANSDMWGVCAVEVSGLAAIGSLFLASAAEFYNYPGSGDRNGPALGVLSGQPALLLSIGVNQFGAASVSAAAANTNIAGRGTSISLAHRRLTSTDSVSGSVNVSPDERVVIGGIALLEATVSVPTITGVSDTTLQNGQTGIVITGTGFGASQGSGSVRIGTSSSNPATGAVTQTVTAWSDTSITITAVQGSLITGATSYLFVTNDSAESNATGTTVSFQGAAAASIAALLMMN